MVAAGFSLRLFAQPVVAGFSLRLKTIDFLSSTQPEGCDYKLRVMVARELVSRLFKILSEFSVLSG